MFSRSVRLTTACFSDVEFEGGDAVNYVRRGWCDRGLIAKSELVLKFRVVGWRKALVQERAREQDKMYADNYAFCLKALCTKQSRMLYVVEKEPMGCCRKYSMSHDRFVKY